MKKILQIAILAIIVLAAACTKKPDETPVIQLPEAKGAIRFSVQNQINGALVDYGIDYNNFSGDTFQVTKLKYYLSNFVFIKTDGSKYTVPKDSCYLFVSLDNGAINTFTFNNLPAGEYKSVQFTMGVDSLKSVSDVGGWTGALDPAGREARDMYWSWNDGFIFFKLEGTSPSAMLDINGNRTFNYHIGGYGRAGINNLKTYNLNFGIQTLTVSPTDLHTLHINANIEEVFQTPTLVNISQVQNVAFDALSIDISNNTKDMFSFSHVH